VLLLLLPVPPLPGGDLESAVESSLRAVNLWNNKVGDKQARQYSGGMKRRLSVAISFTGNPLVVYLDEPSTVSEQWWRCALLSQG
jgi:ABC-type multidrug transport system ATPase subunit